MVNSIATVSVSGSLPEKLNAIAAAGFDGVEIFEPDLVASDRSPAEVSAMLRDLGLACVALQPFRDFEALPNAARAVAFDRAERKFDVMAALGTDLLLVCSSVSPAAIDDAGRRAEDLRELGERAARRGLRIGYEALAWGRHINDHRQAWDLVRAVDHPAVGVILDSFHSLARGIPVESLDAVDPAKVFLVQLADAPRRDMALLSWSRHFRCLPGQGELPVRDYVARLIEHGYAGPLSLEIFNDRFRTLPGSAVALDGMRSLIALRGDVGLDFMPARARCEALEFIEFAASDDEARALERLFTGLGFARAGRHRTKAVTRWRQGAANLVLNEEPDSFAHAYAVTHGASPCAIGIKVDDIASAMERGARLRIPTFDQPPNLGDVTLPAVRGVDGGVIYFTQGTGEMADLWEREFVVESDDAPESPARVTGFDHIAQTLRGDDLMSWLLYYKAMFDFEALPTLDVADPSGLVHNTRLEATGGGMRVVLSEAEGRDTLGSRFVERFFGSGLQHIALACGDAVGAAAAIIAAGGELLPIPANYYDDLAARFGLSDAAVGALAANNVLYDRDDNGGEMLHVFTRAHHRRFFFELVERRGGYDGVDAIGAQVRLAAQSRMKPVSAP